MARVTAIWLGLGIVAALGVVALNVGGPQAHALVTWTTDQTVGSHA